MRSHDTSCEAARVQRQVHKRMGPSARVELAFRMSMEAREFSVAGLRAREPRLSEHQASQEVRRRILGDKLFRAAWPAQPAR